MTSSILSMALRKHAWIVDETTSGEDACQLVRVYDYDLIVVDLGLPDLSGPEILRRLARGTKGAPIFVISGDRSQETMLRCFQAGASDFLAKPVALEEVQSRILAMVRRSKGHAQSTIRCGQLAIDLASHQAYAGERRIKLTRKETKVLELMALNKNRIISKEALMERLYNGNELPEHKIIDVFVYKLRKKILESTGERYIHTSWGKGYVLLDPEMERDAAVSRPPQRVAVGLKLAS